MTTTLFVSISVNFSPSSGSYECSSGIIDDIDIPFLTISTSDVIEQIRKIKFSWYPGPDGIPSAVIKKTMFHVFNPIYLRAVILVHRCSFYLLVICVKLLIQAPFIFTLTAAIDWNFVIIQMTILIDSHYKEICILILYISGVPIMICYWIILNVMWCLTPPVSPNCCKLLYYSTYRWCAIEKRNILLWSWCHFWSKIWVGILLWSYELKDDDIKKLLFCSHARPRQKYCSEQVWCLRYDQPVKRIESVQKQFMIRAFRPNAINGYQLPGMQTRFVDVCK